MPQNTSEFNSRLTSLARATVNGKVALIGGLIRDMPKLVDGSATLNLAADLADKQGVFRSKLTEAANA